MLQPAPLLLALALLGCGRRALVDGSGAGRSDITSTPGSKFSGVEEGDPARAFHDDPGAAPRASVERADAAVPSAVAKREPIASAQPEPSPSEEPPTHTQPAPLLDPPPGLRVQRHADGTCWVWPRPSPLDPGPLVAVRCPKDYDGKRRSAPLSQ